jgi:hypothetical protein
MVNYTKVPLQQQRSLNPAIPLVWLGLAVWGTVAMMSVANQPGPAAAPPAKWPADSALPRPSKRPSLIMFVQPNCNCSKASVEELSLLMERCQGRVNARVLFFKPALQPADWVQSALWQEASAIPGVGLALDQDGREARRFGAETSGEVVLYGADGRLRFQGGITLSRGHLGDNPGRAALQALICHEPSRVTQTPVYGCPLFGHNLTAKR